MNKFFFFLFFFFGASLFAQENKWSVQISQSLGKLIKHSKKIKFSPSDYTQFTELDLVYQTQGKKDWEKYYHLPRMGLGLRYLNLGQPSEILGNAYSMYPFIDFGFFQKKQSSIRFLIGCGFVFLNKIYQIKYNPLQTAIGSHLNNLTTFQFKYEHLLFKTHFASAGISFSHISNGSYKAPNLGLNIVSATIAYSFQFRAFTPSMIPSVSSTIPSAPSVIPSTQSGISFQSSAIISVSAEYGMSLKESDIPGGPKFFIQWNMLDIAYQYNEFNSWSLSLEQEYNTLDIYKDYSKDGKRINLYLAHQWLFGNIGLTFRTGYEFIRNQESNASPIATKLDLCYLIPFQLMPHIRPYIGFSLKAHLDTAEYIGLMGGLRFHKEKLSAEDIH